MTFSARTRLLNATLTTALGLALTAGLSMATAGTAHADTDTGQKVMLKGATTASYYWDDGSGRNGDTGLPASGKPMQKGLAASPSWPLLTEGYVLYKGKKAPFFVGDRGPGVPSNRGIMLDLDAKTFADLTGGTFDSDSLTVQGNGGKGHIKVDYVITKWGKGVGTKNHPKPFSTGAWSVKDTDPAEPVMLTQPKAVEPRTESKPAPKAAPKAAEPRTESKPAPKAAAQPSGAKTAGTKTAELNAAKVSATGDQGGIAPALILAFVLVAGGGAYAATRFLSRSRAGADA
ncbi:hypothetical protein [Planomonospora sp. ID67723]|uniref:hypothetical protein n=1 Tax=Planomonospora sp. ID67723 TaxID=2738134 RepID=UPI001E2F3519|nr:hypothetical protein [Planomonospora sp. ID67723]